VGDLIEIADTVRHGPSGEEWLVARVDGEHLWPCGWPESRARLADCTLIEKATPIERVRLRKQLAELPISDPRALARQEPDHG
jgi:hypothetical protein